VKDSVARLKEEGVALPEWIEAFVDAGHESFYKKENNKDYFYNLGEYKAIDYNPKEVHIKRLKADDKVIMKNTGASLIDLGDDVALFEFTSPNNSIGLDVIQMLNKSIEEVDKNYKGMV